MIDPPRIAETADQWIAFIPLVVPRRDPGCDGTGHKRDLFRTRRPGDRPGRPVVHTPPAHPLDTRRLPCLRPRRVPGGRHGPGPVGAAPTARVAHTVYRGPYEGLGAPGASSPAGSRRTATSRGRTCGSATSSARSRAPTRPRGGRSSIDRWCHPVTTEHVKTHLIHF